MSKMKTYTPTNFRKNIYDLFDKVKNNQEDIQVTIRPKKSGSNSNVLVINSDKIQKLINENRKLKEDALARKIDLTTSKLSSNPIFKNPADFEKWCEENDD